MTTLAVTADAPPEGGAAARGRKWPLARAVLVDRAGDLVCLTVWTNATAEEVCGRLPRSVGTVRAVEEKPDPCRMHGGNTVVIIADDVSTDNLQIARWLFG